MDVLADVLANTRAGGRIFCSSELRAPWGLSIDPASRVGFHVVTQGSCWLRLRGQQQHLELVAGDLVLLPHGSGHTLQSDPGVQPQPFAQVMKRTAAEPHLRSSSGTLTVLLCGVYYFEHPGVHPLFSMLPPLIHLPARDQPPGGPLESVLRLVMAEHAQPGPGSPTVISRLVDVLVIHALRAWLAQQPEGAAGWLGAVRDPHIGRALARMHAEPQRSWTVEQLAAEVSQSRATFARRFRELVGEPPLVYLTRWRMDVAARLLRESDMSLAEVAERVGYASEFAFNRTFHRLHGLPPGRYREQVRRPPPPPLAQPELPEAELPEAALPEPTPSRTRLLA
jgi:AraC-like DNA-binding protein